MDQVFVSLDLEMTSARPENQEILEIAAVKFKGTEVIDSWSTLVNPRCSIPYNIQVLTGIKQEDVNRAPLLAEVVGQFLKFVKNYPLVAHTVSSDVNCLDRKGVHLDNPQIDTFEMATILLPRLPSYSLEAVANYLGISFRAKHRAADDALTQKELFITLWQIAENLDLSIIQEINRLTTSMDWALKRVFASIERDKSMSAFSGASIRQQLAAKSGLENAALDFWFATKDPREPLAPSARRLPVDKSVLVNLLKPGGLFAEKFDNYEHRSQQTTMMEAVADSFNDSQSLIVEAGTGTGKSLAYLLPAAYFAVQNGERVVISTNTINLQDQLYNKDIPTLQSILPLELHSALVKGRSNYLCLSRWAAMRRHHEIKREEIMTLIKILAWLPTTQTGDVGELGRLSEEELSVWNRISAATESCTGNQCTYFQKGSCFLYRARRSAEGSHLIVVNHALLLSDLGTNGVLPDYKYLIVDEAHHLEDEATHQLGFSVKESQIMGYLAELSHPASTDKQGGLLDFKNHFRGSTVPAHVQKDAEALSQRLRGQVDEARESVQTFFDRLSGFLIQHAKDNRGYDTRLLLTTAVRRQPAWDDVEIAFEAVSSRLSTVIQGLDKLSSLFSTLETYKLLDYDALMGNLARHAEFYNEVLAHGDTIISNPSQDGIYWVSAPARQEDTTLNSAPLHVGDILEQQLYSTKECVVMTSATLSTAREFSFIQDRLGFKEARQLQVDSPFDYARSTLVCLPNDMPEPDKPHYHNYLQQAILDICKTIKGRTLILFTSHSQLRQTWQAIHHPLEGLGILVLGHKVDGMPRRQLLETFKTNPKTVLLGAASFWEGIDVVGDALSVLIITRLPFAVPTDPIFAARSNNFNDPFNEYGLPQTILRFKQGFGRLIRSKSDRGVVVVLDSRLHTKSYGNSFIQSLPPCTYKRTPLQSLAKETADWLATR